MTTLHVHAYEDLCGVLLAGQVLNWSEAENYERVEITSEVNEGLVLEADFDALNSYFTSNRRHVVAFTNGVIRRR